MDLIVPEISCVYVEFMRIHHDVAARGSPTQVLGSWAAVQSNRAFGPDPPPSQLGPKNHPFKYGNMWLGLGPNPGFWTPSQKARRLWGPTLSTSPESPTCTLNWQTQKTWKFDHSTLDMTIKTQLKPPTTILAKKIQRDSLNSIMALAKMDEIHLFF